MCGIVGCFTKEGKIRAMTCLEVLKNRGQDSYGLCDGKNRVIERELSSLKEGIELLGDNVIGHALHRVVNFCPQPFMNSDACFVANCEIYNWKELNLKFNLNAQNDAELIFTLLQKEGESCLNLLDGPYAFCYWQNNKIGLARDILGEKPIWFSLEGGLSFASEAKALRKIGLEAQELHPRKILTYDYNTKITTFTTRQFFKIPSPLDIPENEIIILLKNLLIKAVKKRSSEEKVGILFSGGIDSLIIAHICKELKIPFICYTAAVRMERKDIPWDVQLAKEVAAKMNYPLVVEEVKLDALPPLFHKLIPLIEDSTVVKVGVATTISLATKRAKKDGIRIILSGLGAEELFAGYSRHRKTLAITQDHSRVNEDCLYGLMRLFERDLYRDDIITMNEGIELRLPYLDRELINFALAIPAEYKIEGEQTKAILRKTAITLGIPYEFAMKKKVAAQYGSDTDHAIGALARQNSYKSKSAYLKQFYTSSNMRLACLFSSGKDSHLALHTMKNQNYDISCLVTIKSANPDSYMFHTPAIEMARLQAEAMNIPIIEVDSLGVEEEEIKDLEYALELAKKKYNIDGVVSGALYSNYQRSRIVSTCEKLGLKVFSPLWHINQITELHEILREGFLFIFTAVAADGLDSTWLNHIITEKDIERLAEIKGINPAGEGGEYESLVIFGPGYKKKLQIDKFRIQIDSPHAARMIIEDAKLI